MAIRVTRGGRFMRGGLLGITALLLALLAAGPSALGSTRVAHDPGILVTPNRAVAAQEGNPLTAGQPELGAFTPAFIFSDETTAFTIPISGGQFDSVYLTTEGVLQQDASLPTGVDLFRSDLVRLFDDGTNGDVTPGGTRSLAARALA